MQELQGENYILRLLAQVFSIEPTLELLRDLSKIDLPAENCQAGMGRMVEAVRSSGGRVEELQEELSVEFTRLFLGPIKPVAIPFASWHLSEVHQLMTDETIDVRRRYLEADMAVKDLYSTPDDHIGIELEFMSYLTTEIIEACNAENTVRADNFQRMRNSFLIEHMQQWISAFVTSIVDSDANTFYKGAAELLGEVIMAPEPAIT